MLIFTLTLRDPEYAELQVLIQFAFFPTFLLFLNFHSQLLHVQAFFILQNKMLALLTAH